MANWKPLREVKVELFECLREKGDLKEFAEYAWERLNKVNRKNVLYFVNSSPGFHLRDYFYEFHYFSRGEFDESSMRYVQKKVGCCCSCSCSRCKHGEFVIKYNIPSQYKPQRRSY
jgi:hypothetical protein